MFDCSNTNFSKSPFFQKAGCKFPSEANKIMSGLHTFPITLFVLYLLLICIKKLS